MKNKIFSHNVKIFLTSFLVAAMSLTVGMTAKNLWLSADVAETLGSIIPGGATPGNVPPDTNLASSYQSLVIGTDTNKDGDIDFSNVPNDSEKKAGISSIGNIATYGTIDATGSITSEGGNIKGQSINATGSIVANGTPGTITATGMIQGGNKDAIEAGISGIGKTSGVKGMETTTSSSAGTGYLGYRDTNKSLSYGVYTDGRIRAGETGLKLGDTNLIQVVNGNKISIAPLSGVDISKKLTVTSGGVSITGDVIITGNLDVTGNICAKNFPCIYEDLKIDSKDGPEVLVSSGSQIKVTWEKKDTNVVKVKIEYPSSNPDVVQNDTTGDCKTTNFNAIITTPLTNNAGCKFTVKNTSTSDKEFIFKATAYNNGGTAIGSVDQIKVKVPKP